MLERLLVDAMETGAVVAGVVAESIAQSQELWSLRESISEAQGMEGAHIKHDISLIASSVSAFVTEAEGALERKEPGARIAWFGHLGDGNLHFNVLAPTGADTQAFVSRQGEINMVVHDLVAAYNGSISAEHGLGQLRRDENHRSPSWSLRPDALALAKQPFENKDMNTKTEDLGFCQNRGNAVQLHMKTGTA